MYKLSPIVSSLAQQLQANIVPSVLVAILLLLSVKPVQWQRSLV
jgi:hypothetical protein